MKHREAELLNEGLLELKNTGLTLDSLKAILKVKKSLKTYFDEIRELQIEIMKKFNIEETVEGYVYKDHPEKQKIENELREVLKEEYNIPVKEFLTYKELSTATKDMSMIILDKISILVKEEEITKEKQKDVE